MTRAIPFIEGEYFHIYNRGTNKMLIFNDISDKKRFAELLFLANSKDTLQYTDTEKNSIWDIDRGEALVDIGIWTLMSNHFHLVIKSKGEKEASLFLQRILGSHSKYFNNKYDRSGTLFQGKSKSEHLDNDNHLKYMFAYSHLNPTKIIDPKWKEDGIKDINKTLEFLKSFKYSSFLDYLGEIRDENKIINKEAFPDYFATNEEHLAELTEWLNYKNEK